MSNVKVNGNTYNDVTSVKLMKADGSGYAEYKEGAADTDTLFDTMIAGGAIADIVSDVGAPIISWMNGMKFGTVSFPYATSADGGVNSCYFDNLLLPNATDISGYRGNGSLNNRLPNGFQNCKITGVLDLSSLATSLNSVATNFTGSNIGTLKLGSIKVSGNVFNQTVITNFVWYATTTSVEAIFADDSGTAYFNAATITNLYVPTNIKEMFQAKIDEGKLTKITNLYSIEEWED